MKKPVNASICLDTLFSFSKKGHSCFKKGKENGKTYASIAIWTNDEPDKYGNTISISLSNAEGQKEKDLLLNDGKGVIIGNGGKQFKKNTEQVEAAETKVSEELPF